MFSFQHTIFNWSLSKGQVYKIKGWEGELEIWETIENETLLHNQSRNQEN